MRVLGETSRRIKAGPRKQPTGDSPPVPACPVVRGLPMKQLCYLHPFMFWYIFEWKSPIADNYWLREPSWRWKPSFHASLCQVVTQPLTCKCMAGHAPKVSLARADGLCKSGCLSAGRVWAPTSESTVKVNVNDPMRKEVHMTWCFVQGLRVVIFKTGIDPACTCREKAGCWRCIPFLLVITSQLGALLLVKWNRRDEKGRWKVPPWSMAMLSHSYSALLLDKAWWGRSGFWGTACTWCSMSLAPFLACAECQPPGPPSSAQSCRGWLLPGLTTKSLVC